MRTRVAGNTIRLARLRGAVCHGVRTSKPERAFEQSNLLTGQTLTWADAGKTLNDIGRLANDAGERSIHTLSGGTTHALRTIPIFAAKMSQKTRDASAIVFLVHTRKRTRTVRSQSVKHQL